MSHTIREVDEGQTTDYSPEEYIADGHRGNARRLCVLARDQARLAEGDLADYVERNEHVVERATEEDVFCARVSIPGWFVRDDDELREEFGRPHPGATIHVSGLVEDYSDKAFRIIAKRESRGSRSWYEYVWAFVPKSVVAAVFPQSVRDSSDPPLAADGFNSETHTAIDDWREERDEKYEEADDWDAKLDALEH